MRILIVEDNKRIVAIYEKAILSENLFNTGISITKAYNCREGYKAIQDSINKGNNFDLAIIDQNLPPYETQAICSGVDLINILSRTNDGCKTILITAYQSPEIIRLIAQQIAPNILAIKSDITLEKLIILIRLVIRGMVYTTASVRKILVD